MNPTPIVAESESTGWRDAGLPFYKYGHFIRQHFGRRMYRVTVDGRFTCPNVDGTVAKGGCVYCDNRSFSPSRRLRIPDITEQIDSGIATLQRRYTKPGGFLAYFQPATNTYGKLEKLRTLYDQAANHPMIDGLIIGTRPDCVADPVLDLLQEYAQRMFVGLEIGVQSIHDRSLEWMNRGHDAASFFDAAQRAQHRGLDVSTHIILGLPGESVDDMLATARALADTPIDGVKIHNLHVVSGTPMEKQYHAGEIPIMEEDEYADVLIRFLEYLPPGMVIHRVTGDAPTNFLIAPQWVLKKAPFLHKLETRMATDGNYQGRLYQSAS